MEVKFGKRRGLAPREGAVECAQLRVEDVERPLVEGAMVDGQGERVLLLVQPPEPRPEQLLRVHRDGSGSLVPEGLLKLRACQPADGELDLTGLDDQLLRAAGGGDDWRAERRVPPHNLGQGPRATWRRRCCRQRCPGPGGPGTTPATAHRTAAVVRRGPQGLEWRPPACPLPDGPRCPPRWAARTWRAAGGPPPPPRASWPPPGSPAGSGPRARRSCRGCPLAPGPTPRARWRPAAPRSVCGGGRARSPRARAAPGRAVPGGPACRSRSAAGPRAGRMRRGPCTGAGARPGANAARRRRARGRR